MIATDGQTTVVDHNDYNLTIYQAVDRLRNKKKIIAVEFPDYSLDQLYNMYSEPEVLDWKDYEGMSYLEIFEWLRSYEQFGEYQEPTPKK